MSGYTKLFSSIVTSTVWQEDLPTRIVWVTLLALSDKDGIVEGSIPGLAHIARVTIEETERALNTFQQPDKYSRTPDHDGRRIEPIPGGWLILNRAKYRDSGFEQDRSERHKQANRKWYGKKKSNSDISDISDNPKSDSDSFGDKTETEKEKKRTSTPTPLEAAMGFCMDAGITGTTIRRDVEEAITARCRKSRITPDLAKDEILSEWQTYDRTTTSYKKSFKNWLSECNRVTPRKSLGPGMVEELRREMGEIQ